MSIALPSIQAIDKLMSLGFLPVFMNEAHNIWKVAIYEQSEKNDPDRNFLLVKTELQAETNQEMINKFEDYVELLGLPL